MQARARALRTIATKSRVSGIVAATRQIPNRKFAPLATPKCGQEFMRLGLREADELRQARPMPKASANTHPHISVVRSGSVDLGR
jgi:hypothetical protein